MTFSPANRQYGTRYISVMPTNLYGPNDNFDLETSHLLPALIRKFHLAKLVSEQKYQAVVQDEAEFGPIPDDIKRAFGLPTQLSNLIETTNWRNRTNLTDLNNKTRQPNVPLWGTGTPYREFLHVDDLAGACIFLMKNYDESDIINVGSGHDLTIKQLAKIVARIIGFKGSFYFDSSKPDGTARKLLDVSRLDSLGWHPMIPLEAGIQKSYDWYSRRFDSTIKTNTTE